MIWLTTLFMLIIVIHLTRQALAEKQLYEASDVDASRDPDEGLFMRAAQRFRIDTPENPVPLSAEHSRFGRAVSFVQTHTARIGDTFDHRAAQALERDDSATVFGRAMNRVTQRFESMDHRLERLMLIPSDRAPGSELSAPSPLKDNTLMARVATNIHARSEKSDEALSNKVAVQSRHTGDAVKTSDTGFFSRIVAKVSRRLDREEPGLFARSVNRVAARLDNQPMDTFSEKEDLVTRIAGKLGKRMDAYDERFIEYGRKTAGRNSTH